MHIEYYFAPFQAIHDCEDFIIEGSILDASDDLVNLVGRMQKVSFPLSEMYNRNECYRHIGDCHISPKQNKELNICGVISDKNSANKILQGTLKGFSLAFDEIDKNIVEIAIIDSPLLHEQIKNDSLIACEICDNARTFLFMQEFEEHLRKYLNGEIYNTRIERRKVCEIGSLSIVIYPNDHLPPHFHVCGDGINASFEIEDGTYMIGEISENHKRKVEKWYKATKIELMNIWKTTRPTDKGISKI